MIDDDIPKSGTVNSSVSVPSVNVSSLAVIVTLPWPAFIVNWPPMPWLLSKSPTLMPAPDKV